ncbi:MAG: type II toxin-antitoxin system RelB/DinJ family antitoxin [Eggerthellaceae bacterium]|jgi:DNA-damage-inducible protein J|nr:type II toxin-antitoxin system RelB/DinJ family antitoxin [Eggerthellaceae bacterium]
MNESTNVSIRMDVQLKKQAEELFADLGLNMTAAMTIFLRQAVRSQGIPFEVSRVPNAETILAMREAELAARDPNVKGYIDLDELFRDLKS